MRRIAKAQQKALRDILRECGFAAEIEWSISKGATDRFRRTKYSPRLDIAVGPFNITDEDASKDAEKIRNAGQLPLVKTLEEIGRSQNPGFKLNCANPRCLLAIEIELNKGSKYMLGDFTNASMMGLIGLVIGSEKTVRWLKQVGEYVRRVVDVKKAPRNFLSNVVCLERNELIKLLKGYGGKRLTS